MRSLRFLLVLLATALLVAGCGSDKESKKTSNAKKAPTADTKGAKGNVNWCIGKDTSGAYQASIDLFKKANPKVKVKLVELPESADEQRTQLVQRLRAKSDECDVLGMDVIWTAEFGAQNWLLDTSDIISKRESDWIPSTLETAKYEDKYLAVPYHTNAGFLFYRTDEVKQPPDSWEDVYKDAGAGNGIVYQGAAYEGLTVNFLELLYSGGGSVLSDDGQSVEVDSPEGEAALKFMADGIKNGDAPKAVTTYMEEESRRAFESGNATYMRNWPYAYALGKESKIGKEFAVTTFPDYGGNPGAGVLGGYNLAISAYSKNPEGSLAFAKFATSPDAQVIQASKASLPAVLTSVYDDPQVTKALPFAAALRKAVEQAKPRPVSPVYTQISEAIYNNVFAVLQGDMSPDEAATKMNDEIQQALETF